MKTNEKKQIDASVRIVGVLLIVLILLSAFNFFAYRRADKNLNEKVMRVEQAAAINTENIRKLVDYINVANKKANELQTQAAQINKPATENTDEDSAIEEDVINTEE